jgi:tRNA A37 threonylcarbamoyltransferase TsaD
MPSNRTYRCKPEAKIVAELKRAASLRDLSASKVYIVDSNFRSPRLPRLMESLASEGITADFWTATDTHLDRPALKAMRHAFQAAVVDVLVTKSVQALAQTGFSTLVVAGGVGANRQLREQLVATIGRRGGQVFFPEPKYCTDNGAMIAMARALRIATASGDLGFSVRPRWPLQ